MELQQTERSEKELQQTERRRWSYSRQREVIRSSIRQREVKRSCSQRGEEKRNCINQKEESSGAAESSDGADRKQRLIMSRGADLNTSSSRRPHIQGCVYVVAMLAEKLLEKLAL